MPSTIPRPGTGHLASHEATDLARERAQCEPTPLSSEDVHDVVDVAVEAAWLLLGSGESAAATTALVRRIGHAYGLQPVVDITYNRILVSHANRGLPPVTVVRVAPDGGLDHDRLTRAERLVDEICDDHLELDVARQRLQHITSVPRAYRTWLRLLASVLLGGGLAALLGGGPADLAACMLATTLVEAVRGALLRHRISPFFSHAIAACMPTAVGLALMASRAATPAPLRAQPSLVVAAGMVSLLAGVGIVMAAADTIDGYYVTAGGRIIEVVALSGAIVLGVLSTLWCGLALGVPAHLAPQGGRQVSAWLLLAGGALVALCLAVSCNLAPGVLWVAALFGLVAQGGRWAAGLLIESPIARTAVAAVLAGALARLLHHRLGLPIVAIITPALGALMPGLLLYRGVFALTVGMPADGTSAGRLLSDCALTAVALAAGSSLGISLAGLGLVLLRRGPEHLLRPLSLREGPSPRDGSRFFG